LVRRTFLPGGGIEFEFADGHTPSWSSPAEAWTYIQEVIDNNPDLARLFCLAYAHARSTGWSNVNSVIDKNFILDVSDNSPIKLQ
jgi:hypothetical protein